jgi:hypothetical protein
LPLRLPQIMEIVIDSLQDDPAFDAQLASANALIALVL